MTFAVDNSSSEWVAQEALRNLKRMIAYGKLAERVLKSIQENGHYDGRAVVVQKNYFDRQLKIHKFPAIVPVSRADIPGFNNLAIKIGDHQKQKYGGASFVVAPVWLVGTGFVNWDHEPKEHKIDHMEGKDASLIGHCRFRRGGKVSFAPNQSRKDMTSTSVFEVNGANGSAVRFAVISSHILIRCGYNASQRMLDLRTGAIKWLQEDGFVDRAFAEMRNLACVLGVMSV